jgi:FkbM family methyltransferase
MPTPDRPLLIRVAPDALKLRLFARYYRSQRAHWQALYQAASLRFAPTIVMSGLLPGDVISDSIALTGIYELAATRRTLELGGSGGLMVDVGANLGYFSLLWAAARPGNRVIAFEASPRNLPLLRENIARNGLEDHVQIAAVAAGRARGTLAFDLGPADQTGWGGFSSGPSSDGVTVEVVRLDEYLRDAPEIALLKIDIEGADTWALMGCERLLRARKVKEIWFEANLPRMTQLGIRAGEASQFLSACGYEVHPIGRASAQMQEWRATLRPAQ